MYFTEIQRVNPINRQVHFSKAFCIDLISKEDDIEGYLGLISVYPDVQENYFHTILLYLKSGDHESAKKIIDLYVELFNDFDARGLLVMWVSFNYFNFQHNDRMKLYQKRLENCKQNTYVYDFYILNKSILNINYNVNVEEAEFLLENLYNETKNRHIKLVAGINLVVLLENRGQTRFRFVFLKNLIEDFHGQMECFEMEKRYQKLKVEMFENDAEFLFDEENKKSVKIDDDQSNIFRELFYFPFAIQSLISLSDTNIEKEKNSKVFSSEKLLEIFQEGCSVIIGESDLVEEAVNDCYFRLAYEAIEELLDPTKLDRVYKTVRSLSNNSSRQADSREDVDCESSQDFELIESKVFLFRKAVEFLENNDLRNLKKVLMRLHNLDPFYKQALVTFGLGDLISSDLL